MSISISSTDDNKILLETPEITVLYDNDEPVMLKIGECVMAANSSSNLLSGVIPSVILPQSEIDYIVRSL